MQSAAAVNELQERTGQSGLLETSEQDIFCPNYSGPDYKMNYFSTSCTERLANNGCMNKKCERFTGQVPNKNKAEYLPSGREPKLITCLSCGEDEPHEARNLCISCYMKISKTGGLWQFPKTR